jgi:hypothetical protein
VRVSIQTEVSERKVSCDASQCRVCRIGPKGTRICEGFNSCCGSTRRVDQQTCHLNCNHCSGWVDDLGNEKPKTIAVCGKTKCPSQSLVTMDRFPLPVYSRPILRLPRYIPQLKDRGDGKVLTPEFKWFGVCLRDVVNRTGWKSKDFKDYFGLEKDSRLLLHSATEDKVIDNAQRFYDDVGTRGFEAWGALEFSVYGYEGNLQHFWQVCRILECANDVRAHIIPYYDPITIPVPWTKWASAVPNFLMGMNYRKTYRDKMAARALIREVARSVPTIILVGVGPRRKRR